MIKSLYLIAFLTVLTSCSKSNKKYYSGYIYNKNKPIKKAKIIDASNCTHFTFTDEKGYFALKKLETSIDEIIINSSC
ncbi:hypothetical protein [Flavobacterium oreochromis]|uniref:Carboxypeptidase regulatory-like domain-containing protein n=1 Tax=Flavobacterium columnare TaxID=996 RepID=A0A246G7E9_9FLAO|nr:hypothetical protein [Flavobacterium oreochromis]OWP74398.1 hypothetical protein BWK62_14390 [Flavobacterium oreochromis]